MDTARQNESQADSAHRDGIPLHAPTDTPAHRVDEAARDIYGIEIDILNTDAGDVYVDDGGQADRPSSAATIDDKVSWIDALNGDEFGILPVSQVRQPSLFLPDFGNP